MKTFASLASIVSLFATTMLLLPACSTSSADEKERTVEEGFSRYRAYELAGGADELDVGAKSGGKTTDPSVGCDVDADCERIEKGCCDLGEYIAVPGGKVDAYRAGLACPEPLFCPLIMVVDDHSVAQCNELSHKCEVVKPKHIGCNAFSPNPHACPDGWQCRLPDYIADAPGKCVQQCGGFAGFQCNSPDDQCLDDPKDDCDPNAGGADCGGICVGKNDDCRVTSCGAGKMCTPCSSGAWSCVPQGGGC